MEGDNSKIDKKLDEIARKRRFIEKQKALNLKQESYDK